MSCGPPKPGAELGKPRATVEIPSGSHSLQLSRGRYESRKVTFEVADGATATFHCLGARIWVTWLLSLLVADMGISLRQE
jgi:hypothetical protein